MSQLNNTIEQPQLATVMSAKELGEKRFPDISYYWGDLLRSKARMAIIAVPKVGKSFFVMQLGLCIATGTPFLGMETKRAAVLYVNFEISEEKAQERLRDLCSELGISLPENFLVATIPGLALEKAEGLEQLESVIEKAKEKCGELGVLIIDPRRNGMGGDENQSEIVNAWNHNVDELRTRCNLAVVIVHHKGKNTKGAGRGSSVFDGWLDTIVTLTPSPKPAFSEADEPAPDFAQVKLSVKGRDTDQRELSACFTYPVWRLTEKQENEEQSKVGAASDFIKKALSERADKAESELRRLAMQSGITDYAFKKGLASLLSEGKIEVQQDKARPGNWKRVKLVSPSE